jgi:hypothetical protein
MTRVRLMLTAAMLASVTLVVLSPPAAADNCDIFINPEDCQNTGWTIGVIATLTGGVAVASAATVAGVRSPSNENRGPSAPPTPPPVPPPFIQPPRTRPPRDRDDDSTIDGVEVRPTYDAPTISVQPQDGSVRAHSVRLEVNRDRGWQTVQEVHRDPN